MATLDLTLFGTIENGNDLFGSKLVPTELSFNNPVFAVENVTVADDYGTATLWTSPNGAITTFLFGVLLTDADLFVELRDDNTGTPTYTLHFVPANVPFIFGGKSHGGTTARIDGAELIDNTDYADVNRIQVQNNAADDVGDATVSLFLFGAT